MDENWIESVGGIKEVRDDQWTAMKIPMGLVNQIKKALGMLPPPAEPMQIDSSSNPNPVSAKPGSMQAKLQ